MFYVALLVVILSKPIFGAHIVSTVDESHKESKDMAVSESTPHRRAKRQLGEVAYHFNHLLEFLITAASGTFQQTGRMGQDLVGRNEGGLLALLESLFVGVEVSGDFVRNLLNAFLGTFNTALGTPHDEGALTQGHSAKTNGKGPRPAPNRAPQRRRKQSIEALRNSPSFGKRIQAEFLELRAAQRKLMAATSQSQKSPANSEQNQQNLKQKEKRIRSS